MTLPISSLRWVSSKLSFKSLPPGERLERPESESSYLIILGRLARYMERHGGEWAACRRSAFLCSPASSGQAASARVRKNASCRERDFPGHSRANCADVF